MIPLTSVLHNTPICFQIQRLRLSWQCWTCLHQAILQDKDSFYIKENVSKTELFKIQIQKYLLQSVIPFQVHLTLQFISK